MGRIARRKMPPRLGPLARGLLLFVAGGVATVTVLELAPRAEPSLAPWHRLRTGESQALASGEIQDFARYRELESELFDATENALTTDPEGLPTLSRFDRSNPTSSLASQPNWNRSYVLEAAEPIGGALLLHGLSDSPYSLRTLAERLHERGFTVVGPRLPGHGLAPGALADVGWKDWRRVTRLAAEDLAARLPEGVPTVFIGYSNGAGLALDYVLQRRLESDGSADAEGGSVPDRIVLLSPALAVSGAARFGPALIGLSHLPGLEALAWQDVLAEYDPYKYNSFPIRAGVEIHRLIRAVEKGFERLESEGRVAELPPILTIQSAVDATVPPIPSLERLYRRVHREDSELVVFDANRSSMIEGFLTPESRALLELVGPDTVLPFSATLVTNRRPDSEYLVEIRRRPGQAVTDRRDLDLQWPTGVYSLSHVAIPFPPDDPVYGVDRDLGIALGELDVKGERGVLLVPPPLLSRLRYNPFHSYLEARVLQFLGLGEAGGLSPRLRGQGVEAPEAAEAEVVVGSS